MSAQRIDPVLVEKVARAIYETRRPALERLNPQSYFQRWGELQSESMRDEAIAEGRAVVDELGLKEEYDKGTECGHPYHYVRPVGDWRLVEQGDVDGD